MSFHWSNTHFNPPRGKKKCDERNERTDSFLTESFRTDGGSMAMHPWRHYHAREPSTFPVTRPENSETSKDWCKPAETVDQGQVFRHYRSRHWKLSYRKKFHPRPHLPHFGTDVAERIKSRHSYGIICRRAPSKCVSGAQYLVQRRKHSIGLIEMVRSKLATAPRRLYRAAVCRYDRLRAIGTRRPGQLSASLE